MILPKINCTVVDDSRTQVGATAVLLNENNDTEREFDEFLCNVALTYARYCTVQQHVKHYKAIHPVMKVY